MFRRIKINLFQKPVTTLVLFLTFTLLIAFVFFCVSMLRSHGVLYDETSKLHGSAVAISVNTNSTSASYDNPDYEPLDYIGKITYEQIDEILQIEGVIGVNSPTAFHFTPINFKNSKEHTGEDPVEQAYEKMEKWGEITEEEILSAAENISLWGHVDIKMEDAFRAGWNELIEGEFPETGAREAIISDVLAQENDLEIGDTLEFKSIQTGNAETNTLIVSGIYSTKQKFEVLEANSYSDIFANSPYNRIFSDYETVSLYAGISSEIKNLHVYVESQRDVDMVIEKLKDTSINWKEFKANDQFQYRAGIIMGLDNFYNTMLGILVLSVFGGIILFLIIMLSFNDDREIGVLVCIGEKRKNIPKQKTREYLLIAVIALPIAVLIGYFATVILVLPLNPQEVPSEYYEVVHTMDTDSLLEPKLTASFNVIDAVLVAVYALVLVAFSYIINKLKVKKHNTKKFIMGEEEE